MKEGLEPVLQEINTLIYSSFVYLNGQVHFVLGLCVIKAKRIVFCIEQFLLLTMGLNEANSNYACLYYTVKKDER